MTLPNDALLFLVNTPTALTPSKTTTALVAASARNRPTFVVGAADLALDDDGVRARVRRVRGKRSEVRSSGPPDLYLQLDDAIDARIGSGTELLVRTNPASDLPAAMWSHALRVLGALEERGGRVHNPVSALQTYATKTGLLRLPPSIRPRTLVCADAATALDALGDERAVIKPVGGSKGAGVFITGPDDPNRRTAVELLLQTGPVVVQSWISGAEGGDVRLFLIDGEPLWIDGVPAAIARVPRGSELRSNVHLGARPSLAPWTPKLQRVVEQAGPVLAEDGVRIAGLDCIGDQVVEVNACAPGGLTDLGHFAGIDAVGAFLRHVEALL